MTIHLFHATGVFLKLLKISGNHWVSTVFRGYRKTPVTWNGLIQFKWNFFKNVIHFASMRTIRIRPGGSRFLLSYNIYEVSGNGYTLFLDLVQFSQVFAHTYLTWLRFDKPYPQTYFIKFFYLIFYSFKMYLQLPNPETNFSYSFMVALLNMLFPLLLLIAVFLRYSSNL